MTHTEQLRRALRAYDLAGPETPERANALAAVLSAAHGVCDDKNSVEPFTVRINKDLDAWMDAFFVEGSLADFRQYCLWAWAEQERRHTGDGR